MSGFLTSIVLLSLLHSLDKAVVDFVSILLYYIISETQCALHGGLPPFVESPALKERRALSQHPPKGLCIRASCPNRL